MSDEIKLCTKCGLNPRRKSHSWCNACSCAFVKEHYKARPAIRERQRVWAVEYRKRPENRERQKAAYAAWRARNPEKARLAQQAWREKNPNYARNLYRRKLGLPKI